MNSAPNVMALGEFHCLWRLPLNQITCSCGLPFEQEPFWRDILSRSKTDAAAIKELSELESKVSRSAFLLRRRMSQAALKADPDVQRFLDLQFAILQQVSESSGCNILVDSSKAGPRAWIMSCDPRVRIIHLYRDPTDVIASWRSAKYDKGMASNMKRMSVHGAAVDWLKVEQLSRPFSPDIPLSRIDYESLCRAPQETIGSVLAELGLDERILPNWIGPSEIMPGDTYHSLNGNPDRFEKGSIKIAARKATLKNFSAVEGRWVQMVSGTLKRLYPGPGSSV